MKSVILSITLTVVAVFGAGCAYIPELDDILPKLKPPIAPPSTTTAPKPPLDSSWTLTLNQDSIPLPNIAAVVAKVKPSVVSINTEVVVSDIFFGRGVQEGAGSGWIIREDGLIVTNNHVVEDAQKVSVTLDDGRTLDVDMNTIVTDPLTDVAIMKVDAKGLPAATVGDSNRMVVGDWVVAIGNSLGMGIRATAGIVSSLHASITVSEAQTLYELIETDAAINPGNSGGPLVNMAGEVIGITSAKLISTDVEGVGYAISSSEAQPIIQKLVADGRVIRPWLGVTLTTVDSYVAQRYNLSVDKGVYVQAVSQDSPAIRAGIRAGDVIVSFAGKQTDTSEDLRLLIHSARVGEAVEIAFYRGSTKMTATATLVESPTP